MSSNERLFVWNVQINEWEVTGHKRGWTASRWIWGWGQPQRCSGHRDAATYPGRPHGLRRYKGFLERTGRKSGKHAGKHIQHIPTKSFFLFRTHCKPSPSRLLGVTRIICTRHVQIYIYTSIYVYILYVDICWYMLIYVYIIYIIYFYISIVAYSSSIGRLREPPSGHSRSPGPGFGLQVPQRMQEVWVQNILVICSLIVLRKEEICAMLSPVGQWVWNLANP